MRSFLYALLRILNDLNAVKKNKVGRRIGRRAAGKVTQKMMNKIFK